MSVANTCWWETWDILGPRYFKSFPLRTMQCFCCAAFKVTDGLSTFFASVNEEVGDSTHARHVAKDLGFLLGFYFLHFSSFFYLLFGASQVPAESKDSGMRQLQLSSTAFKGCWIQVKFSPFKIWKAFMFESIRKALPVLQFASGYATKPTACSVQVSNRLQGLWWRALGGQAWMQNKERTWAQDADSLVTLGGEADFWTLKKYLTDLNWLYFNFCIRLYTCVLKLYWLGDFDRLIVCNLGYRARLLLVPLSWVSACRRGVKVFLGRSG